MSSFGQSEQIDGRQKHNNTAGSLSVENSKLKAIIREVCNRLLTSFLSFYQMRTDMESMQGEMSTVISEVVVINSIYFLFLDDNY